MDTSTSSHASVASSDGRARAGPFSGYSAEGKPLASYAALSLVFNAAVAGALVAGRDRLPDSFGAGDILLMGVASHKFSRLVSKDKVTSFIRAPFVRYEGPAGPAEVSETARGDGMQRTIGELLICPYCLGQWITAAYAGGLLFAPRVTRWAGAVFAAHTVSDFLQLAYNASQDQV